MNVPVKPEKSRTFEQIEKDYVDCERDGREAWTHFSIKGLMWLTQRFGMQILYNGELYELKKVDPSNTV